MRNFLLHSPALALTVVLTAPTAVLAQSPDIERIWTGAYTEAQADRGKQIFEKSCATCHGPALAGANGPSLRGDRFLKAWDFRTVDMLFTKIRDTMPPNAFNSVNNDMKLDLIAFLLQQNGFPAGPEELKIESKLDQLPIVKKGTRELPNFVLVRVTGCLQQASDGKWILTKASDPMLAQDKFPNPGLSRAVLDGPLGNGAFVLVSTSAFHPSSLNGSRVEARGLLYREPGENRLNLSSLASLSSSCAN